jgi:threonine/homoserine/homoserine lactone efflux protein
MESLWAEFLAIALLHLLAVASPGPDFAVVVRQSVNRGRSAALWTSAGIGSGILLHVSWGLVGVGLLAGYATGTFEALKWVGAAYLAWLGVGALRSRGAAPTSADGPAPLGQQSPRSAYALGFLTNALNVKAALFFVSLFTVVISASTPALAKVGYGLWMAAATFAWFAMVSVALSGVRARRAFLRFGVWFDRAMGLALLALAARLAFTALP